MDRLFKLQLEHLQESGSYQTGKELQLKMGLIKLLRDKHHAAYAERLRYLDVIIVPLSEDENFTAAVSFETAEVYVGEGFLIAFASENWTIFDQLDVVLRHEIAHNLLMHQIRMLDQFIDYYDVDEETARHIQHSSLHGILNIIEDFEISNTRYTDTDKEIMRNIILNGKEIHCLVTEDHNEDWAEMSLEEMFHALTQELEDIKALLLTIDPTKPLTPDDRERLEKAEKNTAIRQSMETNTQYMVRVDDDTKSYFFVPIEKILTLKSFKKYSAIEQKLMRGLYDAYKDYSEEDIIEIITEIGFTTVFTAYKFKDKSGKDLGIAAYTPEDKTFAINVLLALMGRLTTEDDLGGGGGGGQNVKRPDGYVRGYNEVVNSTHDVESEELVKLLRHLGQAGIDISHITAGPTDDKK
jgi:hypothetical protein